MPSDTKESLTKVKAAKRGIVEQKPVGSKNKRPRPFAVEYRIRWYKNRPYVSAWRKGGSYRTEAEAITAMENQKRKHDFYEVRLSPSNPPKPV